MSEPHRIIDSHIHLWDPSVLRYPWLDSEPDLRRPFLPADLRGSCGVTEWVVVQADAQDARDQGIAELEWVASLAASEPSLRGMVVRAPVESGRAVLDLLELVAAHPLTVGVRRLIQDEPVGFAQSARFIDGVRAVGEFGLPFDVCVRAAERGDIAPLVDACPDVSFVLDHLGKPDIAGGEWGPWREQLIDLARRPNVVCKLSGSTTEAGAGWREYAVRPYLEQALESFGANRCMFASDWPVASLTTTYPRWLDLVSEVVAGCSDAEIDDVFAGTARRVYAMTKGS
ncbi:MAG TPA: amidohydrolase family protein [Acidothermaceae bacterium]